MDLENEQRSLYQHEQDLLAQRQAQVDQYKATCDQINQELIKVGRADLVKELDKMLYEEQRATVSDNSMAKVAMLAVDAISKTLQTIPEEGVSGEMLADCLGTIAYITADCLEMFDEITNAYLAGGMPIVRIADPDAAE